MKSEPIIVAIHLHLATEKEAKEFIRVYANTPNMRAAREYVKAELARRRGLRRASRVAREILNG